MNQDPVWIEYLDESQKKVLESQRGVRRLLGLTEEKLKLSWKWVTWKLWGRRAAIRQMKKLALSSNFRFPRPSIDAEQRRLRDHRDHLDSLKVPLPTPDTSDIN